MVIIKRIVWLLLLWGFGVCAAKAQDVVVYPRKGEMLTGELVEYSKGNYAVIKFGKDSQTKRFAASETESLLVTGARPSSCQLQATARLTSGAVLSGVLVDYALYKHASISLGEGEPTRLQSAQIKSVELAGGFGPRCENAASAHGTPAQALETATETRRSERQDTHAPASVSAPITIVDPAAQTGGLTRLDLSMSENVRAAAVQQLLAERADWVSANTSTALPVAFTTLTVVLFACSTGFAVDAANNNSHDGSKWAAVGTAIGGGTFLLTSIVLWATRTSQSRQEQEVRRIDEQLRTLGFRFSIRPWASPGLAQADANAGMVLTLRL
jgi:hypothetical protein